MAPARKTPPPRVATPDSSSRRAASTSTSRSAAAKQPVKASAAKPRPTTAASAKKSGTPTKKGASTTKTADTGAKAPAKAPTRRGAKPPSRGGRDALVEAVLAELSVKGPANIYPNDISTGLGLSKSLVNFHFGNRDGLVAEAMAVGYERYVDHLWSAALAAGSDPVSRLLAWIDAQLEWTVANVGLAAALNFPHEAAALDGVTNPDVADRLSATGRRNLTNLSILVRDAILKLKGPKAKVDQVRLYLDLGVIGWMTLGMSVFTAGRHLPTADLAERSFTEQAKQHLHQTVIEMLKR